MDTDIRNYFPLKHGNVPPSSIRMAPTEELFQFDWLTPVYLKNKADARKKDGIEKYYQAARPDVLRGPVLNRVIDYLVHASPMFWFNPHKSGNGFRALMLHNLWTRSTSECVYHVESGDLVGFSNDQGEPPPVDLFDALAMHVPEDMVLCHVGPDKDEVVNIHLMAANGWSAKDSIGSSFAEIHDDVRNSKDKHVVRYPRRILEHIMGLESPVERVGAISFRPEFLLNRHPEDVETNSVPWTFHAYSKVYLRFERQVVVPFPEVDCFLFNIRTYFTDMRRPSILPLAVAALKNMHEDAYSRVLLTSDTGRQLLEFLEADLKSLPNGS